MNMKQYFVVQNQQVQQMFCCTISQQHSGQIVTSICKNVECIQKNNQLCCTKCIQQNHKTHKILSIREHLHDLLKIDKLRIKLQKSIKQIVEQLLPQYYEEDQNVEHLLKTVLKKVQHQLSKSKQESSKIKQVLKGVQEVQNPNNLKLSSLKQNVYGFSHKAKHPHLSVQKNSTVLTKTTNSAHKNFGLTATEFSQNIPTFSLKIDKSGGNVMIGICQGQIVQQKEYINCYGMSSGTYLLGQNAKSNTAICFHHTDPNFNRKQIVGWNFKQGDIIDITINFTDSYLTFRNTKQDRQFTMNIQTLSSFKSGPRLIVALQNINDQVTLLSKHDQ